MKVDYEGTQMNTKNANEVSSQSTTTQVADGSPPYVPWKSFESFVAALKSTHAPAVIDGSVMPSTMGGGLKRNLRSTLKFLGLTDATGNVSAGFAQLISAHGTDQWQGTVKEYVVPAYNSIIGDLPVERATSPQLEAAFKSHGVSAGQMLEKSVRFYLHALKSAKIKYSNYWSIRAEGTGNSKTRKRAPADRTNKATEEKTKNGGDDPKNDVRHKARTDLIEFPLHFGDKATGIIGVPPDMDKDDLALFDATVAVVKAYCARNKSGSK